MLNILVPLLVLRHFKQQSNHGISITKSKYHIANIRQIKMYKYGDEKLAKKKQM